MIIEFKYDINDSVWFIRNAKIYCGVITEYSYFKHLTCGEEYKVKHYNVISGYGRNTRLNEDELFSTRDELLENLKKENNL